MYYNEFYCDFKYISFFFFWISANFANRSDSSFASWFFCFFITEGGTEQPKDSLRRFCWSSSSCFFFFSCRLCNGVVLCSCFDMWSDQGPMFTSFTEYVTFVIHRLDGFQSSIRFMIHKSIKLHLLIMILIVNGCILCQLPNKPDAGEKLGKL